MSFFSIPLEPRAIRATEAVLERIYTSARLGLKGDALALNAGLHPQELNQLLHLDPLTPLAVLKGMADSEAQASRALHDAADAGDVAAAKAILQYQHKWAAPQQLAVTVEGKISVLAALAEAEKRVMTIDYEEVPPSDEPANILPGRRTALDGPAMVADAPGQAAGVDHVRIPVGRKGDALGALHRPA